MFSWVTHLRTAVDTNSWPIVRVEVARSASDTRTSGTARRVRAFELRRVHLPSLGASGSAAPTAPRTSSAHARRHNSLACAGTTIGSTETENGCLHLSDSSVRSAVSEVRAELALPSPLEDGADAGWKTTSPILSYALPLMTPVSELSVTET